MLRPRYKRSWGEPASRSGSAEPVPVVLPLVAITIAEDEDENASSLANPKLVE